MSLHRVVLEGANRHHPRDKNGAARFVRFVKYIVGTPKKDQASLPKISLLHFAVAVSATTAAAAPTAPTHSPNDHQDDKEQDEQEQQHFPKLIRGRIIRRTSDYFLHMLVMSTVMTSACPKYNCFRHDGAFFVLCWLVAKRVVAAGFFLCFFWFLFCFLFLCVRLFASAETKSTTSWCG